MSGQRVGLLLLAVAAIGGAAWYRSTVLPKPSEKITPEVVFIASGTGPYWQLTANGARAAAKAHDVKLRVEMPKTAESLEQQMLVLADLDCKNLGGVAFSPIDAEAQTRLINQMSQETYVVTLDADAPLSQRHCHIGTSNIDAGRLCADLVEEAVPAGGKVAVLVANLTKSTNVDRKSALAESLGQPDLGIPAPEDAPKYEIVATLVDDGDDEKCRQLIGETLEQHPDLACFVGLNARYGPLLLQELKKLDQLDKVKLVTFDEAKETLEGLEAGHIYATVAQDPYMYGYESVRRLAALCRGDKSDLPIVGGGTIHVNAEAIRKDNLDKFRQRLAERLPVKDADEEKSAP